MRALSIDSTLSFRRQHLCVVAVAFGTALLIVNPDQSAVHLAAIPAFKQRIFGAPFDD